MWRERTERKRRTGGERSAQYAEQVWQTKDKYVQRAVRKGFSCVVFPKAECGFMTGPRLCLISGRKRKKNPSASNCSPLPARCPFPFHLKIRPFLPSWHYPRLVRTVWQSIPVKPNMIPVSALICVHGGKQSEGSMYAEIPPRCALAELQLPFCILEILQRAAAVSSAAVMNHWSCRQYNFSLESYYCDLDRIILPPTPLSRRTQSTRVNLRRTSPESVRFVHLDLHRKS